MKVYFLSGLGADKTVFQFLDLDFCEPVFIEWIPPHKNESLPDYALRLKDYYHIPENAFVSIPPNESPVTKAFSGIW